MIQETRNNVEARARPVSGPFARRGHKASTTIMATSRSHMPADLAPRQAREVLEEASALDRGDKQALEYLRMLDGEAER